MPGQHFLPWIENFGGRQLV